MKSQILTIRVSETLKGDLDYLSEMNGESISDLSRKAIENYVKNSLGEDDTSFNFVEDVFQVHKKGLLLNETEISDLYYKLKATFDNARHNNFSISTLHNELKSTKTELQTLITLFWFYLDDIFSLDDELDYDEFNDFLQGLYSSIKEPKVVVLKIP
jgi:predicted transcriptional regulator